ncbi:hypothetical protein ACP4OV_020404 [Aristida adscensionis]
MTLMSLPKLLGNFSDESSVTVKLVYFDDVASETFYPFYLSHNIDIWELLCVNLLRMRRAPFFQLCDLFRTRGLLRDTIHNTIEEQVAMFLHMVGHNQRFRVVDVTFRRSIETISRYFKEVLYAIGELRDEMIVPPSNAVPTKILHSRRWYPYFKGMSEMGDLGADNLFNVGGNEGGNGDAGNPAQGGQVAPPAQGGQGGNRNAMRWTLVMSGFVLRRFADLVGQGMKTDKGFKEVHVNSVARKLSEFSGLEVTGTQVYNHLRKWCQKWMRVCKLKDLSGALWDEDNYMIVLVEEHLVGHCKDHPKDVDFLNTPIENYLQMQIIFGSGQATGRFAMAQMNPLDVKPDISFEASGKKPTYGTPGSSAAGNKCHADVPNNKRKRVVSEEAYGLMKDMTVAVNNVA